MSFSFSVKEATVEQTVEAFKDELHKQSAHVPRKHARSIASAGHWLADGVDEKTHTCALATAGHFNADGTGNAQVSMIVSRREDLGPEPVLAVAPDTNEA